MEIFHTMEIVLSLCIEAGPAGKAIYCSIVWKFESPLGSEFELFFRPRIGHQVVRKNVYSLFCMFIIIIIAIASIISSISSISISFVVILNCLYLSP